MSSSSSSNPSKTTSSNKIPQFDVKNFTIWKSKAMMVLETMDYSMIDIVKKGPHIPTIQSTKDNVQDGDYIE